MTRADPSAHVAFVATPPRAPDPAQAKQRGWMRWTALAVALGATLVSVTLGVGLLSPGVPSGCTFVAAPGGSDEAAGSISHPFRSLRRLLGVLGPGETGCLRAGVYAEDVTLRHGGRQGDRLTLRSFPGQTATIRGRLYLARGSSYTTIEYLHLDGRSPTQACAPARCPSPSINSSHVTFSTDDVTNHHTAICFDIGSDQYGIATHALITHNSIHDCGVLPASNHDHGIYVQAARDTRIEFNAIYNNADRGIQFYPAATGTIVVGNLIAHNGEDIDFSASGTLTSSHNLVEHNVIIDSVRGYNVSSYYGRNDRIGTDNVVVHNCIGGGVRAAAYNPMGIGAEIGFTVRANTLASASSGRPRCSSS